ncbi:hypothetical protein Hdeb2414_s0015g00449751 [Helianthus debilis subsp. tardiflorus]
MNSNIFSLLYSQPLFYTFYILKTAHSVYDALDVNALTLDLKSLIHMARNQHDKI